MSDHDSHGYEVIPNYTPPAGPITGIDDFPSYDPDPPMRWYNWAAWLVVAAVVVAGVVRAVA